MTKLGIKDISFFHYNERDVEVPAVVQFVKNEVALHPNMSLLDVGAHYSYATYALTLRGLLSQNLYDGCDIVPDPPTQDVVNNYFVGNVRDLNLDTYDTVISISVIEHCGLTTYKKENIEEEQLLVVEKMMSLANRSIFLTFPYGMPGIVADQYSNIHEDMLDHFPKFWTKLKGSSATVETQFFYNELPRRPEPKPWIELDKVEASKMPIGKCFCLFQARV